MIRSLLAAGGMLVIASSSASEPGKNLSSAALPDIDTMLGPANANLNDFLAQNEAIQQGIVEQQAAHVQELEKQKKGYETQLLLQSRSIGNVTDTINVVQDEISQIETANKKLTSSSKHQKKANQVLREAIRVVIPKMKTATNFLHESMTINNTDAEKTLVDEESAKPGLESFLKSLGPLHGVDNSKTNDGEKKKMSLLGVGRAGVEERNLRRRGKTPTDLIEELQKKITDLAAAGEEGAVHMQANFIAAYETGEEELKEKNDNLHKLIQERDAMVETQKNLHAAEGHLNAMNADLTHRLEALQTFASVSSSIVDDALQDSVNTVADVMRKGSSTKSE